MKYIKNVAILSSGSALAQLIVILFSPLITRFYSPEYFGELSLYIAIVMLATHISTLRYELAIILPKNRIFLTYLSYISFFSALVFAVILYFVIILFSSVDGVILNNLILILPLSILVNSYSLCFQLIANKTEQYRTLSISKVLQATVTNSSNVLLSSFQASFNILVIGNLLGNLASILTNFHSVKNKLKIRNFNILKLLVLAKRNVKFPKYSILSGIFDTASSQAPIFLLTFLYPSSIVGFYALANRLLVLPLAVIGTSVGQVYHQEVSKNCSEEKISRLTFETVKKLSLLSFLPFTILLIFGDLIFKFVFGAKWVTAGELVQILSPWLYMVFISWSITPLLIIKEKQEFILYFNSSLFFFRCVAIYTGWFVFNDYFLSILFFSAVGFFYWLYQAYYIFQLSKISKYLLFLSLIIYFISAVLLFYLRKLLNI